MTQDRECYLYSHLLQKCVSERKFRYTTLQNFSTSLSHNKRDQHYSRKKSKIVKGKSKRNQMKGNKKNHQKLKISHVIPMIRVNYHGDKQKKTKILRKFKG